MPIGSSGVADLSGALQIRRWCPVFELPPVACEVREVAFRFTDAVCDVAGVFFMPAGDPEFNVAPGVPAETAEVDAVHHEAARVGAVRDKFAIGDPLREGVEVGDRSASRNEKKPCVHTNMMAANVSTGPTAHSARRAGPQTPAASGKNAATHTIDASQSTITGSGARLPDTISARHEPATTTVAASGSHRRQPRMAGIPSYFAADRAVR